MVIALSINFLMIQDLTICLLPLAAEVKVLESHDVTRGGRGSFLPEIRNNIKVLAATNTEGFPFTSFSNFIRLKRTVAYMLRFKHNCFSNKNTLPKQCGPLSVDEIAKAHVTLHFWQRWQKAYISELQQRCKWKQAQASLKLNDLVLIKEDNIPPKQWKLGRICKLFPGRDGVCRVAAVKTASGILRRAFSKLCIVPVENED
ncbi:hypothetical protein NQ317_019131 [Molorchus minor]|uniref:DUF5641 domain-containing protein n=1 Tax=Molorchus minor TaxID=1323400 RepID=A0ABQ9JH91_9CUCU|nr:hypothetical protein NQ317_019131 [Molorchus minor]